MDSNMFEIVKLALVSVVLMYFIIPFVKSKVASDDMIFILQIVDIAVKAAEQMFNASGKGPLKKEFVIDYIRKNYNLKITDEELGVFIEAAVKELNLWQDEIRKE